METFEQLHIIDDMIYSHELEKYVPFDEWIDDKITNL